MTVTLNRAYGGFTSGSVVDLSAELEAALIAQGLAITGGTLSSGAQSTTQTQTPWTPAAVGIALVAAAASSVVISNSSITATSKAFAVINQSAADTTLTSIVRAFCAAGTLTITGNAASTAAVRVSYVVFN